MITSLLKNISSPWAVAYGMELKKELPITYVKLYNPVPELSVTHPTGLNPSIGRGRDNSGTQPGIALHVEKTPAS